MLSPHGKMSRFQTAQMFSLQDPNIFNIAVRGVFDDCQDMVKAVSNDLDFKSKYCIGTVNSINWARVSAQVVYYFKGYFAATKHNGEQVSFTVPSGNFGNVCAGHIARMMGLPIRHLVVATNENDVLDEFFRTGVYRPSATAKRCTRPALRWTFPRPAISSASSIVTRGLYRYTRNPMYLGVLCMGAAWPAIFASSWHLVYAGGLALAFQLFVVLYEEPRLQVLFGAEYDAYRCAVPRWLPRLGPRTPG